MTEAEKEGSAAMDADAAKPQTAGQWLKAARQQRGLHIAALAALLKVPQSKLEALEADRYQDLPDATFARALAKAVCRTLKVDATPVMALLPSGRDHELHVSLGINAPYREAGSRGDGLSMQWLSRPVVWIAGLIVLAAVGVYFMPAQWLERATSAPAATTAALPASDPVFVPAPSEPASTPSQAPVVQAPASAPAQAPAQAPVVTAAVTAASVPASAPRQAAPAASKPVHANGELALTVKTTAASWVEVVDANGQTLISRIVPGGEEEQLSGAPPLKVKIGNVAGTQLVVRGKPMDLLSQSKDNVARFELN